MACLPANARKIGRPEARSERKDRVFWNFKALFFLKGKFAEEIFF